MTVELKRSEAEILIALLHWAETTILPDQPMALALADLREWRSALLLAYLRATE
jgi:hypothetical protein